jgi:hypothetical protein
VVGYVLPDARRCSGVGEAARKEPKGVAIHDDGRPLPGRKVAGRSPRELRDVRLLVENEAESDV